MSLAEVATILNRAVEDDNYRSLLFSGSTKALIGYELSESEISMLMRIDSDSYASTKGGLTAMRNMLLSAQEFKPE